MLEQRAISTARADGVWRHEWVGDKNDQDEPITKRRPQGLIMSEALTRCPAEDDDERAALVDAFTAIERGALAGASHGMHPKQEEE